MKRWQGDSIHRRVHEAQEQRLRVSYIRRLFLLGFLTCVGAFLLLWRMFFLQVRRYDYYRTRAQSNRVRMKALVPERGIIYDAKGRALTENILRYQVVVNPSLIKNVTQMLEEFSAILPLSDEEKEGFLKRYQQSRRYEQVVLKHSISEQDYYRLAVRLYQLPGVEIDRYLERYYPYGALLAHVVGYTNRINSEDLKSLDEAAYRGLNFIGRGGIERQYEDRLRGSPGFQQVETDANGNIVRLLSEQGAYRGQDIYLSIDVDLQRYITEIMQDYRGSCVVLNVEDGSVLALVSLPSYDANLFTNGISKRQYQRLVENPQGPLFHRALKGRYAPGSVIKPVMSLAGYYYGVFDEQTHVFCSGHYTIPESSSKRRFHCWKRSGHGSLDANHALAESCDVYYYSLGYQLGISRIAQYAAHFSLGKQTGIDLPDEGSGIMPTKDWKLTQYEVPWYIGDTINISIGQGFLTTTPLQLAYMTALIARDGKVFTPRLLKQVYDPIEGQFLSVREKDEVAIVPVYQDRHWRSVKKAMENVIHSSYGTGNKMAVGLKYRMAGKSGTVQVVSFKNNERIESKNLAAEHQDNAMFIAYAPAEAPKIAISVVVERGGGGSSTAGPLARLIADFYLQGAVDV